MEHISLYRKWRPQTFAEVVGQRPVTTTLTNALSSGRLVHAYLFSGPRGTGKTSTARILAKAMNCVEGPTAAPCNECEACRSISEGTAMDVIEIDAASNRKIDEIRDLLDKIPYAPTSLRSKVYIIDEVHQLTAEASSALLKTLEEPPGHVVFVLATTEPHKLLPTIVSRCQRYDFSQVSAADMVRLLEHIATSEGIDVETEALAMIAKSAHGSVRDAVGVMDQISNLHDGLVTRQQLSELLGEVESELLFEAVDMLAERDTPGSLGLIARVVDGGKDPRRFVEALIGHLRNVFLIQNASSPGEIVDATTDHFKRLSEQSETLSRHEVIKLMESLGAAHRDMRWSENPRLVLEVALVKSTRLDADVSLEGLAFRVEELERAVEKLAAAGAQVVTKAKGAEKTAREPRDAGGRGRARKETTPAEKRPGAAGPAPAGASDSQAARRGKEASPAAEEERPREGGPSSEREKVRRGWMAVMAELKKAGHMKLYALLTRARVQAVEGDNLVLAFPGDARFQMDVLAGCEADRDTVERAWERLVGEKVNLKLVAAEATGHRPGPLPPDGGSPAVQGGATAPSAEDIPGGGEAAAPALEAPGPEDAPPSRKEKEPRRRKASAREVAERLKERFDGEIIVDNEEGKD